jgi:hypothetical protein
VFSVSMIGVSNMVPMYPIVANTSRNFANNIS